jgi:hypothetical protein
VKIGRLSYRLSRWRNVREVNVGSAGRGIGEEQREEKGDTPGEEGAVSFEGQEDGLVVEERKEKFSSNIIAGGICVKCGTATTLGAGRRKRSRKMFNGPIRCTHYGRRYFQERGC